MSYLQGRRNIYSLISSSVINYIRDNNSENNNLKATGVNDQVFLGIPNNLVSSTTLYAECGDDSSKCVKCMNEFGIDSTMLEKDNYKKNIEKINNVRNNECFGVCSCQFTNVSLSTNLIFTTGVNINMTKDVTQNIVDSVKNSMTKINKSESTSGDNYNWQYALLGGGAGGVLGGPLGVLGGAGIGAIASALSPEISHDVEQSLAKVVSSMFTLYSNTINQLITSSQEVVVKGTGIKVHNISLESIQDITLSASQQDCGSGDCVMNDINELTNNLMKSLQKNISTQFSDMFTYAFNQNKTLIIVCVIFVTLTMLLWFFLLFKTASRKK